MPCAPARRKPSEALATSWKSWQGGRDRPLRKELRATIFGRAIRAWEAEWCPGCYVVWDVNDRRWPTSYSRENEAKARRAKMLTEGGLDGSPSTARRYLSCSGGLSPIEPPRSSGRRYRFEIHADPVEPAPSRSATPTTAIHVQVELLRKTVGIGDQKQRASRRHVANRADFAGAAVMQNDLSDPRSLMSRNKPSFSISRWSSVWRQQGRCLLGWNKGD
jgi:hypothetical protein